MSSSSLRVFCTQHELQQWLRHLCETWSLACLSFRVSSTDRGMLASSPEELVIDNETFRIFLFPQHENRTGLLDVNDARPREWGWVDVRPGGLTAADSGQRLLLTEVHAEDSEHESVHPTRFVKWLKKDLKSKRVINYGVFGRNMTTGGESLYKDLGFSSEARNLYESGIKWAQLREGPVIFEPADR